MSACRHFAVLFTVLALLTGTCVCQDATPVIRDQTVGMEIFLSPSGKMCRLRVVPCRRDQKESWRFSLTNNDVIERLVPKQERGAFLRENSGYEIGNCTHRGREDYQNVTIDIDANACYEQQMTVTWKGVECPREDPSPVDLCGRVAERSQLELYNFSKSIELVASMMERQATEEKDEHAKQLLLADAKHLRMQLPSDLTKKWKSVRVPDSAAALALAESWLIGFLGKSTVDAQRPFTAVLKDGFWTVSGTSCCKDEKGQRICESAKCKGGVAVVMIRQLDGGISWIK